MIVTRAISITNFLVATSALCFQVTVLYPWHKQLDEDFEALKKEHLRVLQAIEDKAGSPAAARNPEILDESRKGIKSLLVHLGAWKA